MKGKVADVQQARLGTELAADAALGASSISVEDLDGISSPSGSGQLAIVPNPLVSDVYDFTIPDAVPLTGEGVESDELDLEDDGDADVATVNVTPNLVAAYPEGTKVYRYPASYERTAWVVLDGQEEEIPVRVADDHLDRLLTSTRSDPELAETVEIGFEDGEYVTRDVAGEQEPGLVRGYTEVIASTPIVSTDVNNPTVIASLDIEIPTSQHRLLFYASANLNAADGRTLKIGFDDSSIDFAPGEFPLVTFYGGGYDGVTVGGHNSLVGPSFVAPALAPINLRNGSVTLPNGLVTGNVLSEYFPTLIQPYNLDPPTPGLHKIRLTGYKDVGAGSASVDNVRFWATVI